MKWKVIDSEYLFQDPPWLSVRKDRCMLPNGKLMPAFYVNEYPEWVTGFALTANGKVVLVKQYRHGIEEVCIETPGGVVDNGESPEAAVKRELLEETGYSFSTIEYLGKICANPSTANNFLHMYLLQGGEKTSDQQLDETEDVEVALYSIDEIKTFLKNNSIRQSMHASCMFYALNKLGEMAY